VRFDYPQTIPQQPQSATNVIETAELRKTFKSRRGTVEAVQGIDLQVREGEIFGFLGPNGAGKTTTLRMLCTLMPPTSGMATIAGCDLLRDPQGVRERIGYVSQNGGADQRFTARENLILQARLYGIDRHEAEIRAAEWIAALDLEAFADRLVKTYSGGQRRRLDLALAFVHRPAIVFLDEPSTGLDPQSRVRLWDEIRRLRETGTTLFLTTHYMDEADALCDRIAIIDQGSIVAEGTSDELKRRIAGDVVSLGLDSAEGTIERAEELLRAESYVRSVEVEGEGLRLYVDHGEGALPPMLRLLDGAGIGIRTLALHRPSLDDVFLQQTGRSLREGEK
jgi:ABC-2 type transport system ATP-binding protein